MRAAYRSRSGGQACHPGAHRTVLLSLRQGLPAISALEARDMDSAQDSLVRQTVRSQDRRERRCCQADRRSDRARLSRESLKKRTSVGVPSNRARTMPVFGRPYEKVLDTALRESVKAVTQTPSQKMVEAQQPGHHADHRPAAVW